MRYIEGDFTPTEFVQWSKLFAKTPDPITEEEKHDFMWAKYCTMQDQRRGFYGGPADGPFSLAFRNLNQCLIWIGEGYYDQDKPAHFANWAEELQIHVNGIKCAKPDCRGVRGEHSYHSYSQTLIVDARAVLGGRGQEAQGAGA